jgi:predicted RNA-binding Zn ribbon-like protein
LSALAADYLAIAEPANHRLDDEVSAYADHAHHDLAAAEKALRAEAATERSFDRQLAAVSFPPAIEATARALIRINEIRARLALRQAAASSLPALLSFAASHKAADAEVEAQVRVIRAELGLPPPKAS